MAGTEDISATALKADTVTPEDAPAPEPPSLAEFSERKGPQPEVQETNSASLPSWTLASMLSALSLFATATRLWKLHIPETPVYDETHVGRFLSWYTERAYFFDVHPPLSKLLMLATALAFGYEGRATCPYEKPEPFAANCDLVAQRLLPAICGALLVPLVYATCAACKMHPLACFLAAWLILTDTMFIGVSRIHLNDMVQMLFIASTHFLGIFICAPPVGRPIGSTLRGVALIGACGLCIACALQSKFAMALTTLGWLGLQNIVYLAQMLSRRYPASMILVEAAVRGVLLLGIPVILHLVMLDLHLRLLPRTGNGDGYMSAAFQATLDGNRHQMIVAEAERPGLFAKAVEHAGTQFWYNQQMATMFPRGSHAFDSAWYTWPFAWRGVYFGLVRDWAAVAAAPQEKHLLGFFLHPNPITMLFSTALAIISFLTVAAAAIGRALSNDGTQQRINRAISSHLSPGGAISLLVACLIHWLPYSTQNRQTFLLYYLPAYYFAILLAARVWNNAICSNLPRFAATAITISLCALIGGISCKLSAMVYASRVHIQDWNDILRLASTECWVNDPCWANLT